MDGVVIRRNVELGDTVTSGVSSFNAGTVLMTVADVGTMIIKAGVNEVDIGKVRLEQPVKVSLDAYPEGAVRRGHQAHRARRPPRGEGQGLRRGDRDRPPGRRAAHGHDRQRRRAGRAARTKVLTVPVEALFRKDDAELVYVKKAETPQAAESPGFLSQRLRRQARRTTPPPSSRTRTSGRRSSRCATVETGLAASTRSRSSPASKPGDEVAVEDPTKPREKKDRE